MKARRAWIERLYDCTLYLYPRAFRHAWGEPMRQALRDRLRERAADPRGNWRVLMRELAPDLLASACREHWIAYDGEAAMRRWLLVSLLLGSLLLLSSRETLSLHVQGWQQRAQVQRVAAHDARVEARRAALLQALRASPDPDMRALARPLSDWHMTRATTPAHEAPKPPMLAAGNRLAVLLAAGSCDADALAQLQSRETDNGATWAISTTCALRNADDAALQHALRQLVTATRYDSASGRMLAAATAMGELPQGIALRVELELDATGFVSSALWGMHVAETEGVLRTCVRGLPRAADLAQPALDVCPRALALMAASADSTWARRVAASYAARLEGFAPNEAERLRFKREWDTSLAAWLRHPAAERINAAAAGADERALLAGN
jgi:hypothetical protein